MASRKDQLHSYQFMLQRAISALIMRETDPAQSPLRRGVGAAFVGVMVTVIVAAVFGIYGLLTKTGSAKWKVEAAVVVEKETGAAFVYREGTLVPAANYTSALLVSGQSPPASFVVPRNSLRDVPRAVARGIEGAPASLPTSKSLLRGPWAMCAVPARTASGQDVLVSVLSVGSPAAGAPVGDGGLYVTASGGDYLVWHGYRYRLSGARVPKALFPGGSRPIEVGSAWLDTLPEGDAIREITIPDDGERSDAVAGHRNGEVVTDRNVNYLVLDNGLARLTDLQLDLLRAARTVNPVSMQPDEIADAPESKSLASDSPAAQQAPARTPPAVDVGAGSGPCVTFAGDSPVVSVASGGDPTAGTPTGSRTADGEVLADRVAVPGGSVAVVRERESGAYALVTDGGVRYAVESAETLGVLGFDASGAVTLPAAVLHRVPAGPALTRAGADRPVSTGGR
ncbi:type VII secretion protein EccB [Cryptosporangium sp. NPDC048952]|uniref:type VII secretion protein EccB n=1 Tax=Cryptosporangium sp. NPDC048952 TaxID=3363961 RepID=UPI00371167A6